MEPLEKVENFGRLAHWFFSLAKSRIDAEACSIREELDKLMTLQQPLSGSCNNSSETAKDATVENLKAALVEIQLCSRLESLLLKKKSLNNGDSPELHTEKVEKLKVLSESLANSTSQAEKRILDHRESFFEAAESVPEMRTEF
ncbi:uncharacterized protein LOC121052395 isoform X2 [Rosa chinensis]|uniref:uncharacterized protein LOC112182090 isoform X2 n=1 Tax=Rosa chinensis TaxID=74649 RepID=UPI001AD92B72|nr:uncharacterized protein LOC112182090 isoform X2 [Rosa chinensis]XP_040370704.1 uncharacterized protein LOC112199190 isoform X2 [Rosa chinensis]XP_040373223.1 uncharacterized protein LOC121052395 isoform X2 [Rosa chinensis]